MHPRVVIAVGRLEEVGEVVRDSFEAAGGADQRLDYQGCLRSGAPDRAAHRGRGAVAKRRAADVSTVAIRIVGLARTWPTQAIQPGHTAGERGVGVHSRARVEACVRNGDHLPSTLVSGP